LSSYVGGRARRALVSNAACNVVPEPDHARRARERQYENFTIGLIELMASRPDHVLVMMNPTAPRVPDFGGTLETLSSQAPGGWFALERTRAGVPHGHGLSIFTHWGAVEEWTLTWCAVTGASRLRQVAKHVTGWREFRRNAKSETLARNLIKIVDYTLKSSGPVIATGLLEPLWKSVEPNLPPQRVCALPGCYERPKTPRSKYCTRAHRQKFYRLRNGL